MDVKNLEEILRFQAESAEYTNHTIKFKQLKTLHGILFANENPETE